VRRRDLTQLEHVAGLDQHLRAKPVLEETLGLGALFRAFQSANRERADCDRLVDERIGVDRRAPARLPTEFEPLLLAGAHEGDTVIAGIAALHYEADEHPKLARPLLQALTEALIAEDIIDPITYVG
jgi:hypothetical protein